MGLHWNAVRENPGAIEFLHNPVERRKIGLYTNIITYRWEMKLRSRCEPTYEWNFVYKPWKTKSSPIEMLMLTRNLLFV